MLIAGLFHDDRLYACLVVIWCSVGRTCLFALVDFVICLFYVFILTYVLLIAFILVLPAACFAFDFSFVFAYIGWFTFGLL